MTYFPGVPGQEDPCHILLWTDRGTDEIRGLIRRTDAADWTGYSVLVPATAGSAAATASSGLSVACAPGTTDCRAVYANNGAPREEVMLFFRVTNHTAGGTLSAGLQATSSSTNLQLTRSTPGIAFSRTASPGFFDVWAQTAQDGTQNLWFGESGGGFHDILNPTQFVVDTVGSSGGAIATSMDPLAELPQLVAFFLDETLP